MGQDSKIEWTDHTFNPWWGCVNVSPACDHCYAETFAKRTGHGVWGHKAPRRFFGDKHWAEPVKWNKAAGKAGERARVFCASMADVFEDRRDLDEHRTRLWKLIRQTPHLDWLLLTKRPDAIRRLIPVFWMCDGFPANVWLGVTVESDNYTWRAREIEGIPARVKFISYEPALGPLTAAGLPGNINWIIAGGESGAGHRPADPDWFRRVRDLCASVGVRFFFKQWGGFNAKAAGRELDGREWSEFPS